MYVYLPVVADWLWFGITQLFGHFLLLTAPTSLQVAMCCFLTEPGFST